jgi:hypothetical protein
MVLFCLTFSKSSLASTYTLASPWHQVPDFYERLEFCSTLVSTLEEGIIGISSWGQWDGPCPIHAHILVGIEHLPHSNESSWFGNMFWLMNVPFMRNIFMLRDTAKPSSPRTILQHTAVSRPRLTICIASICSVRSKLSQSIDSVFFLSFCDYHELRNTRLLKSCLVRRNSKFVCLGIQEACWMCLLLYGSQV